MYCPTCGTEAMSDARFCRKCGLDVALVKAALDARLDQAGDELRRGALALRFGMYLLILFAVITLYAAASAGPFDVTVGPLVLRVTHWWVGLILALVFGIPALALGRWRVGRASKCLERVTAPRRLDAARPQELSAATAALPLGADAGEPVRVMSGDSDGATQKLEPARPQNHPGR